MAASPLCPTCEAGLLGLGSRPRVEVRKSDGTCQGVGEEESVCPEAGPAAQGVREPVQRRAGGQEARGDLNIHHEQSRGSEEGPVEKKRGHLRHKEASSRGGWSGWAALPEEPEAGTCRERDAPYKACCAQGGEAERRCRE